MRYYVEGGMIRTNMPCADANWTVAAQDRGAVACTAGITIALPEIVDALQGEDYRIVNASDGDVFVTASAAFHAAGGTSTGETISSGRSRNYTVETDNLYWTGVGLGMAGVGTQGAQGIPGSKGETGDAGLQGAQGLAGPVGPTGSPGAKGDTGEVGVVGPAGPQGLAGPAGPGGIKGDTGNVGPQGAAGLTGPSGAIGATGPQGPVGLTGATGAAGTNATTTATATSTTAGLMPASAVVQLAALPTIIRASIIASVPTLLVAGSTTMNLTVTGAQVGGIVTINCSDATLNGSIVLPLTPVTVANQISVTLKAAVAISAGSRTFSIAVINP